MRKDMYKVIVERPRRGGGRAKPGRDPRELDALDGQRSHESLRLRHGRARKWLNENLRPLQRYLDRQVGRRWDFVYSELCARVDRRNTVQQHIHQHLDDFVAQQVHVIDGELHVIRDWGGLAPLAQARQALYVDPDNGCLMRNDAGAAYRAQRLRDHRLSVQARNAGWRDERRTLDEWLQLHRLGGLWYRVELAPEPAPRPSRRKPDRLVRTAAFDAVLRAPTAPDCGRRHAMYGRCGVYARSKRQLAQAELIRYGLRNGDQPDPFPGEPQAPARRHSGKRRSPFRTGAQHKEH